MASAPPARPPRGRAFWLLLLLVNLALAATAAALAPARVGTTGDRTGYEYVGAHGLEPDCPHSIYCYRVLVPAVLERVPLSPVARWRLFATLANAAAGFAIARAAMRPVPVASAGLLAAAMAQTSFGFTFAVWDPFTPDPAVFLAAALIGLAWLENRPWVALAVAAVGVFAKETVALVSMAAALASLVGRRDDSWRAWLVQAAIPAALLLGFHLVMDRLAGWSETGAASANLGGGSWLALWIGELSPGSRLFYVFAPFGFGWLFAALGARHAPPRLLALAVGFLPILVLLVYVENVERALGNAFFVVVPLAVVYLARVPSWLAATAVVTNGLFTARAGLSTPLLPSAPVLLALAAAATLAVLAYPVVARRWTAPPARVAGP